MGDAVIAMCSKEHEKTAVILDAIAEALEKNDSYDVASEFRLFASNTTRRSHIRRARTAAKRAKTATRRIRSIRRIFCLGWRKKREKKNAKS